MREGKEGVDGRDDGAHAARGATGAPAAGQLATRTMLLSSLQSVSAPRNVLSAWGWGAISGASGKREAGFWARR